MIPRRDADFIAYAKAFTEYIRVHRARMGVRMDMFNVLRDATAAAVAAWELHIDINTASRVNQIKKDLTFKELRPVIGFFHDYLRGSFDLVTPEDLKILGIRAREKQVSEPVTKPVTEPNCIANRKGFYNFAVVTKELEEGGQRTKRIRNTRLHPFIVVRYCFIPINTLIPVDREELPWITNQAVGHSRTTINATGKAGLKLVVQSAFHNTAGTGPWSEPFEIIVS